MSAMNTRLERFVFELNQLNPADDDSSFQRKLCELADTIEDIEDLSPAFSHIFGFFERSPNAEHGSPGPLVHLVERFRPAYFGELARSVERRPTRHTLWMLNRIQNSTVPAAQRAEFMALLEASSRHPLADAIARAQALHYSQYQRDRSS
jgi:hypothetical protein